VPGAGDEAGVVDRVPDVAVVAVDELLNEVVVGGVGLGGRRRPGERLAAVVAVVGLVGEAVGRVVPAGPVADARLGGIVREQIRLHRLSNETFIH